MRKLQKEHLIIHQIHRKDIEYFLVEIIQHKPLVRILQFHHLIHGKLCLDREEIFMFEFLVFVRSSIRFIEMKQ